MIVHCTCMCIICLFVRESMKHDISISKRCVPCIHIFCLCCARHDVRDIYIYNLFCHMYVLIILIECINAAPFILATQEKLLFPCTVSRNHGNRSLNLSYRTCVLLILYLVGGLEHVLFFHILEIVIPTDFHIFQRGRYTTNQI